MTNQRHTAAFFDLDLTITDRDSFRYYLIKEYLHNYHNWIFVPYVIFWGILKKLRIISLQTFKEKALISIIYKNKAVIQENGKAFFKKHLLKIIRKKAVERIKWHKKRGHFIFIISASPDIYIYSMAKYLECNDYACSQLLYKDGKFIGKFNGKDCMGNEKVKRIKEEILSNKEIDLTESYAYSDHESDLPLFELVGNPIVISPTENLKKIARCKGWKIENW